MDRLLMVEVVIDNRSGQELPLEHIAELATAVLKREMGEMGERAEGDACGDESGDGVIELSLSFVDTDEITQLNTLYRDRTEPTDVLSFELDNPRADSFETAGGRILLGDIVVQPDIARTRAAAEGVDFEEELGILVIHGILHLLGYDHMEQEDARLMEAREDEHFLHWERGRNAR
jgi:probable rRNA maturation factor